MFPVPPKYRVGHTGYVSEFTQFIDHFLEEHPECVEDQHRGWNLFWDHKVDFAELELAEKDHVPVHGYEYFSWDEEHKKHLDEEPNKFWFDPEVWK